MKTLPSIKIEGYDIRDRGEEYFTELNKVKDALFSDPTVEEIEKIRSEVKKRSDMYSYRAKELDAYIKANDNTRNEEELRAIYLNCKYDMYHLHEYIGKIKISHLVQPDEVSINEKDSSHIGRDFKKAIRAEVKKQLKEDVLPKRCAKKPFLKRLFSFSL